MKIYTKTGDEGMTGLIGGSRVAKSDPRIACYGTVDELNAAVGSAAVACIGAAVERLRMIQNELFVIGSHLAMPNVLDRSAPVTLPPLEPSSIARLESEIDAAESQLAPLKQFILPGGSEGAARLHVARTVCRRAERLLVTLADPRDDFVAMIAYLNRLSDWLFVQARLANHLAGVQDIPWQK